jgi:hypothetical protein
MIASRSLYCYLFFFRHASSRPTRTVGLLINRQLLAASLRQRRNGQDHD